MESAEERRRRIKLENEAAERRALEAVAQRRAHLERLEFERSAEARQRAAQAVAAAKEDKKEEKKGEKEKEQQEGGKREQQIAASSKSRSIYDRGFALLHGIGVSKDPAAGAALVKEAAEQGLSEACFLLGECFMLGDGCPVDCNQAAVWFQKAADAGELRAQTALGLLYLYELKDRIQARKFLEVAAKRGDADAARELKGMEEKKTFNVAQSVEEPVKKKFWWDRTHELKELRERQQGIK